MKKMTSIVFALISLGFSACETMPNKDKVFDQSTLPESIKVEGQYTLRYQALGRGTALYRCTGVNDERGRIYQWQFVGPEAKLYDQEGKVVGTYTGPPTYFALQDGSGTSASPLRVSSNGSGNLTLQLLEAHSSNGDGEISNSKLIQRINTKGGAAPANPCTVQNTGAEQKVAFSADYLFWR